MKVTVDRKIFEQRLKQLREVVAKNLNTMPIIGCAHLEAVLPAEALSEGALILRGTNLEQHASFTIPAKVESPGVLLLAHQRLTEVVSASGTETIRLEEAGPAKARLVANGAKYQLFGMAPEEYPSAMEGTSGVSVGVKAELLAQGLRFAEIARLKGGRPILEGIEMQIGASEIRLQATDGHRVLRIMVPIEGPGPAAPVTLIPPPDGVKTLAQLLRGETDVRLGWWEDSRDMELQVTGGLWRCRLQEGAFPAIDTVLESQLARASHQVTLEVPQLLKALRQVISVTEHGTPAVDFLFDADPELGCRLAVHDTDTGEAEVKLPVEWRDTEPGVVRLNGRYVVEYLAQVETGSVLMRFGTETDPVRFGGDGDAPTYVVMPMRR